MGSGGRGGGGWRQSVGMLLRQWRSMSVLQKYSTCSPRSKGACTCLYRARARRLTLGGCLEGSKCRQLILQLVRCTRNMHAAAQGPPLLCIVACVASRTADGPAGRDHAQLHLLACGSRSTDPRQSPRAASSDALVLPRRSQATRRCRHVGDETPEAPGARR